MSNVNVAVVRRWFEEVWNQRRAEAITELLGDESVCHGDEGPIRGAEEFTQRLYNPFVAAFPDLRINLDGEVEQGIRSWSGGRPPARTAATVWGFPRPAST